MTATPDVPVVAYCQLAPADTVEVSLDHTGRVTIEVSEGATTTACSLSPADARRIGFALIARGDRALREADRP